MLETTQSGARKRFFVIMGLFLVFRLIPSLLLGGDSGVEPPFPSLPPPRVYADGGDCTAGRRNSPEAIAAAEALPIAGIVLDWR